MNNKIMAVAAFNDMLGQLLSELGNLWPKEPSVLAAKEGFDMLKFANARMPCEKFMQAMHPFAERVLKQDETIFAEIASGDMEEVHALKPLVSKWSTLSASNKSVIWQYLKHLVMLGNGIVSLPTDLMKSVENLAQDLAHSIKSGKDPSVGLENIQQVVKQLADEESK